MRLFGRLSSVTALTLSVMLLQPTASKADYQKSDWEMGAIKCAALYWMATAYPNDEGRRQELVKLQTFHISLFHKNHRRRFTSPYANAKAKYVRITNGHLMKDKSVAVLELGSQYDRDPHALASLLRGCRNLRKRVLTIANSNVTAVEKYLAEVEGVKPPKYDASDFRKSKRIVDRWFKAWTKMGRPTPQSMRENFKRKLRGN